nr:MAG TPA: hypothetical protein [Caudoviricetes sp.]
MYREIRMDSNRLPYPIGIIAIYRAPRSLSKRIMNTPTLPLSEVE